MWICLFFLLEIESEREREREREGFKQRVQWSAKDDARRAKPQTLDPQTRNQQALQR